MNKATFERQMKAVATGKSLNQIRILAEDGTVYDVERVSFENEQGNGTIWIHVSLAGDDGQR